MNTTDRSLPTPRKRDTEKMPLERVRVTQTDLFEIVELHGAVRVGATDNIRNRAGQYERKGYGGTMYFAPTENMKASEDRLLQSGTPHNIHKLSNGRSLPGYTYVIKGEKYN